MGDERRSSERLPVDLPGELFLSAGRRVAVRIQNIGRLGALVQITDLEDAVLEGERAVLDHPVLDDETAADLSKLLDGKRALTPCAVVRVALDFEATGIHRELAVHFDGGPGPDGYEG